ncbi:MAG: hypothetical protein Q4B56_07820, partial [Erysipelotrichaceae bacterium]|nr:hypothetical protein [Erysipelotrichaceae bacterium]
MQKLNKFRKNTRKQLEILAPDYDENINQANGKARDYLIPELLQNINDCKFSQDQKNRILNVQINHESKQMILQYDEIGFDFENVYSITSLGQSSKHDEREGEKGLGFKKVFTLFNNVEIYSNDFYFSISQKENTIPNWISDKEKIEKYYVPGKTTMVFSTNSSLNEIAKQWVSLVKGAYVGTTLSPIFLKNIDEIHFNDIEKFYSKKEMEKGYIFKRVNVLEAYEKTFENIFDKRIKVAELKSKLKLRKKCKYMTSQEKEDYVNKLCFEICIPTKKTSNSGYFYSTLPTGNKTHTGMNINLPLELSTGRDSILEDSQYNEALFNVIFRTDNFEKNSLFNISLEQMKMENPEINIINLLSQDFDSFKSNILKSSSIALKLFAQTRILSSFDGKQSS